MSELTNVKNVLYIKKPNNRLNKYYHSRPLAAPFANSYKVIFATDSLIFWQHQVHHTIEMRGLRKHK